MAAAAAEPVGSLLQTKFDRTSPGPNGTVEAEAEAGKRRGRDEGDDTDKEGDKEKKKEAENENEETQDNVTYTADLSIREGRRQQHLICQRCN